MLALGDPWMPPAGYPCNDTRLSASVASLLRPGLPLGLRSGVLGHGPSEEHAHPDADEHPHQIHETGTVQHV
jgi:hypothetical protein